MKKIFIAPILTFLLLSSCDFSSGDGFDKGEPINYMSARSIATEIYNKTVNKNTININQDAQYISVHLNNDSTYLNPEDNISLDFTYSTKNDDNNFYSEDVSVECSNIEKYLHADSIFLEKHSVDNDVIEDKRVWDTNVLIGNDQLCVANDINGDKRKMYYPAIDLTKQRDLLLYSGFSPLLISSKILSSYYISFPAACAYISLGFDIAYYIFNEADAGNVYYSRYFYSSGKGNLTAVYHFKSLDGHIFHFNRFEEASNMFTLYAGNQVDFEISWDNYKPYKYVASAKTTTVDDFYKLPREANMSIQFSYDKVSPRSVNLDEYRTIE